MSKPTKIIYFIESPFNRRDYKRFGVETFIRDGFEVFVWDFTPFLHPQVDSSVIPPDPIKYKNLMRFNSKKDAIAAISKEWGDCFVISLISYHIGTFSIFRQISKNNIPYSVFRSNSLPNPYRNKGKKNLFKKIKRLTRKKLINYSFIRIPSFLFGVSPATFALAGGAKSSIKRPLINSKTEVLWIHTLDYDIYLDNKEVAQGEANNAVFVDEYLPFHPEFIQIQAPFPTTPEEYYPLLCRFFDFIEYNYGTRIIIAAHPRSRYEKLPDYFGGRPVIRGKTAKMVRESKFVIIHDSTCINFAVLYSKPVIFITTSQLDQSFNGPSIKAMASWFGKQPFNIDNPMEIDWDKELTVDEEAYSKYKNCYIKKNGSKDIPFWEIVSNKIKNLDL